MNNAHNDTGFKWHYINITRSEHELPKTPGCFVGLYCGSASTH